MDKNWLSGGALLSASRSSRRQASRMVAMMHGLRRMFVAHNSKSWAHRDEQSTAFASTSTSIRAVVAAAFLASPSATVVIDDKGSDDGSILQLSSIANFIVSHCSSTLHNSPIRENAVLKRGVAIQHERQKEFDVRTQEVDSLKEMVLQYQEQLRTLEASTPTWFCRASASTRGRTPPCILPAAPPPSRSPPPSCAPSLHPSTGSPASSPRSPPPPVRPSSPPPSAFPSLLPSRNIVGNHACPTRPCLPLPRMPPALLRDPDLAWRHGSEWQRAATAVAPTHALSNHHGALPHQAHGRSLTATTSRASGHWTGSCSAKLAKLRGELLTPTSKGGGGAGEGFDVTKSGDARVGLVGIPSVGKSTLLNKLTWTFSEVQIQLQLTIEAQGRYLQMIIEEQQKLGGSIKASEDQKLSDSPPSLDDYPEIMQPSPKKPRIDALSPDSERDTTQPEFESHLIGPWDHGIAFPLEEFKADPTMSKS
uniref:G domain-containing protein n=1 Tax=Zea mays TaxID=4577 RepID=A0A804LE57_MAIZE